MSDQQQLVEQVVLEPEHDFVVTGVRLQGGVALAVLAECLVERPVRLAEGVRREIAAADLVPVVARHERRRSLVQYIGPRDERARHAGSFHESPRGITVRDVQHHSTNTRRPWAPTYRPGRDTIPSARFGHALT
jgi:hypothetical protein